MLLGSTEFLNCRHLKNGKIRERFSVNFSHLPETEPPKGTLVIDPIPGSFTSQGRSTLTQDRRLAVTPHSDKPVTTIRPHTSSFKGPFIFPNNDFVPLKGLLSPSTSL